jgi:hypothetical protein
MRGFGASDALIRRRSRRGLIAAIAIAVPVVLAVLSETTELHELQFAAACLACLEAVVFLLLPALAPQGILTGERRGELHADRTGVWFRKRLVLRRERIESVWVEALADDKRCVHLYGRRASDDLSIFVDDDVRAESLLAVLALEHERHTESFLVESGPLRTPSVALLVRRLALLGGALLAGIVVYGAYREALVGLALVPVLFLYSMLLRRLRRTTRLLIGTDVIVVRAGGLVRRIPNASLRSVALSDGADVLLQLASGESLCLRFAGDDAEHKSHAFASRVQKMLARFELLERKPDAVAAQLVPGGRSTREWLADIRALTANEGYRCRAVPDEDLWCVVENGDADAAARVAALAALQPRLGEEQRVRIAEIAGGTAHPDVRAAFDAAAAGAEDAQILEAFARESDE